MKLLLIEDDQFLRELYLELLQGENYDVDTAVDGEEALSKIQQKGWDIVLLDNMLPKKTGLQIIQELQKQPRHTYAKFMLFLSNSVDQEEIKEAMKYCDGYLMKSSLTPPELLEKIKQFAPN